MTPPNLTETLANLNITWILAAVAALTAVRLSIVRIPSARSASEFLESAIIAIVLVYLLIRPFIVQAFFIPSASMAPTLLGNANFPGDKILVNKFDYRLHKPTRGDVVVFIAPKEAIQGDLQQTASTQPVDFIKRLIAVPGDRLQVIGGKVIVNGRTYNHSQLREALATAGEFGPSVSTEPDPFDHHVKFTSDGVTANGKLVPNSRLAMILTGMPNASVLVLPGYTILNGHRIDEPFVAEDPDYDFKIFNGESLKKNGGHGMYQWNGQPISEDEYNHDNAAPAGQVPPHRFFMMGDNRNDSDDSTEWGPLDDNRVVGRAQFIFWPLSRMRVIH